MKKSIYSITQHTDLKSKDIEKALFEAADLLLYLEPQLSALQPPISITGPIQHWMETHKPLLSALIDLRLQQVAKGADDLYIHLYRQRFIPALFNETTETTKEA